MSPDWTTVLLQLRKAAYWHAACDPDRDEIAQRTLVYLWKREQEGFVPDDWRHWIFGCLKREASIWRRDQMLWRRGVAMSYGTDTVRIPDGQGGWTEAPDESLLEFQQTNARFEQLLTEARVAVNASADATIDELLALLPKQQQARGQHVTTPVPATCRKKLHSWGGPGSFGIAPDGTRFCVACKKERRRAAVRPRS